MTNVIHQGPMTAATGLAGVAPQARVKRPWYKKEFHLGRPVKPEELMTFSRQMASFTRAGITVLDALAIVREDTSSTAFGDVIDDLRRRIRAGAGFGEALQFHTKVFPQYYVSMVRSADLTGALDEVLEQLSDYIQRDMDAKRRVKSALTYPTFVMGMAMLAIVVLSLWVLPKFKSLYGELNAALPLPTRILLGFTDFMTAYWWLVSAVIGIVALVGFAVFGGKRGKSRRDTTVLKLPAIGPLLHFVFVERFCRVLSTLVTAGVSLPDAIEVASDSTNNRLYQRKLAVVREAMIRGEGLAGPIVASELFPAAARQMIRVGENTGTLDQQLHVAAMFYERELEYRLKKVTDLFEPFIILFVGSVVGFVAIAQVSAMYSVFGQIKAGG